MTRAGRLLRFGSVGLVATGLYAGLAAAFAVVGLAAVPASLTAYALAGVFSYLGQRHLTFRSTGPVSREAPRFGLLALAGWAIAAVAPAVLTDQLGLPVAVPILVTCLLVPALNFLAMDRLVFSGARR